MPCRPLVTSRNEPVVASRNVGCFLSLESTLAGSHADVLWGTCDEALTTSGAYDGTPTPPSSSYQTF